jgi:hypothetical protein
MAKTVTSVAIDKCELETQEHNSNKKSVRQWKKGIEKRELE